MQSQLCRLYRRWLNSAQPGDVEKLIFQCPVELRNNLLVLLRDLLMHFPQAVLGIPCLVQHSWSDMLDCDSFETDNIDLPGASSEVKDVAPGIELIGWARPGSAFTSTGWQRVLDEVTLVPGAAVGAIALFKAMDECLVSGDSTPSDDDDQVLCISDLWWARLMVKVPGNLMLQTHRLLPCPEAVEAARIMCDTAGVEQFNPAAPTLRDSSTLDKRRTRRGISIACKVRSKRQFSLQNRAPRMEPNIPPRR
ncbi:hypothetical protein [Caballeronia zhejiangensis]|uniref:hypothetical protein n=1 Tax=Caballeronia zhejiangensis TaxID=871203 RepID=UPI001EF5AF0A|nr:hypothetical protein [Caballeronia zhejiangensis]MCG7399696.1 hypothetical protein [Caballeronia zhejiangensis]